MCSLTSALKRFPSSTSLRYSQSGQSPTQRVYLASAANRDLCLSFLRRCADYGEKVIGCRLPSIASPTSFRVMASHDLRERTMRLRSEMTGVSVENATLVQGLPSYLLTAFDCYHRHKCSLGSRKFKSAYKKALSLETKTTSGLNTLLEKHPFWITVSDGHVLPDGAVPDVITLGQLRELWERVRDSVRVALATLKGEPAPRLFYRSSLQASKRPRSVMERWLKELVCFS
jgi:hypothetical protein